MNYLIHNATLVNDGTLSRASVYIKDSKIEKIVAATIPVTNADKANYSPIDAQGCYLLPGVIDTHVHFRDPGMTDKADFASESTAAAIGGVTSVVDMPNTEPQTTTLPLLEEKEQIAAQKSKVNYGFMLGATNDNIETLLNIDPTRYAAIKLFLGSSTGNMLVNNDKKLDLLFEKARKLIVAHCEEEAIVQANLRQYKIEFANTTGETAALHPKIRNTEACYISTYKTIERALKYNTRIHIAHISTATELNMLDNQPLEHKKITAEVTPNHLWFDERDYVELGNLIKCNPAIKNNNDRLALWAALYDGRIDTIGSDHAPHTKESNQQPYFSAPSGIPSIQHMLQMMLEAVFHSGKTGSEADELINNWLPLFITKMCHNPATLFGIKERGYIREGYWADLVIVRPGVEQLVKKEDLGYKCKWSPLEGMTLHSRIEKTFVNGTIVHDATAIGPNNTPKASQPLEFTK